MLAQSRGINFHAAYESVSVDYIYRVGQPLDGIIKTFHVNSTLMEEAFFNNHIKPPVCPFSLLLDSLLVLAE